MPKQKSETSSPSGFPAHGQEYQEPQIPENDDPENTDDGEDEGLEPDPSEKDAREREIQELRTQIATMAGKMDILQQELSVARQPPKPEEPDDFYDKIDEKLFQKPDVVLKGLEDRIVNRVSQELNSSYQKDQGERDFWRDFYSKHPDLKDDDDLVKATLQGNLNKLGGMPVSEAITSLATLTRDRITRYAKKPRQRPQVEGATPPTSKKEKQEEPQVVTLSDIIRARRNKRRGAAA